MLLQRHIFARETTPAPNPSFCSTQCHTTQNEPQAQKHLHLGGQAGSAPQKWLQQVISRCEGYTANKRRADNLLRCTLLPTSGDGTIVPGFSWAGGDPLHQYYQRLILKSTEAKGSISTAFSGSCPLLGWSPSSWAEQGIAAWRWVHEHRWGGGMRRMMGGTGVCMKIRVGAAHKTGLSREWEKTTGRLCRIVIPEEPVPLHWHLLM